MTAGDEGLDIDHRILADAQIVKSGAVLVFEVATLGAAELLSTSGVYLY